MSIPRVLPLLLCLIGCATVPLQRNGAPVVDHHLHLLSAMSSAAMLREAPLPQALTTFLRERERHWNNANGLAPLFAEDGVLFTGQQWLEGRRPIAAHLANGYTGPYLFRPTSYRIDGATAQIAGFMVEDDGTDVHFAFFHHNLRKSGDTWRIASETQTFPGPVQEKPYTADQLVRRLDETGIRRGVVLSNAYYFAVTPEQIANEYDKVRAENDWTAQQVAQFPERLVAFCSVNPLREYALAEVERCAASKRFRGLKLHLNAAQIKYDRSAEVGRARRVIEAANRHRMPLIIHVRSSNEYGREHAQIFLRELVAAAPDVTVQIAHLWGGESFAADALDVYAEAVALNDPAARNLYFDISGVTAYARRDEIARIVAGIRRIGLARILYASDAPPAEAWAAFRKLPLTEEEIATIAGNVAPYMDE